MKSPVVSKKKTCIIKDKYVKIIIAINKRLAYNNITQSLEIKSWYKEKEWRYYYNSKSYVWLEGQIAKEDKIVYIYNSNKDFSFNMYKAKMETEYLENEVDIKKWVTLCFLIYGSSSRVKW